MSGIQVLYDAQIDQVPLSIIDRAIRDHLIEDAQGLAVAPARHGVEFPNGSIIFTTGGSGLQAGFRAYETFAMASRKSRRGDQIVVVWDRASCRLKGVALGNRLGAVRTGVLGGVAVDVMAGKAARVCGIVGAGAQAETQIRAASLVRQLEDVRVFSRNAANRSDFAERIGKAVSLNVRAVASARECVEDADIVILATSARTPVVDADWIGPTAHVTTVGPKSRDGHELPLTLAARAAVIASDSPQQIERQGDRHMLGEDERATIVHLGELAQGFDPDVSRGITLYLSTGLAGTEVAALDAALAYHTDTESR